MEGFYWANFGVLAAKSGSAPGGAVQVRQVQKGVFWAWSRGLQRRNFNWAWRCAASISNQRLLLSRLISLSSRATATAVLSEGCGTNLDHDVPAVGYDTAEGYSLCVCFFLNILCMRVTPLHYISESALT